jgi:long-chain acyl-CoA synthetase
MAKTIPALFLEQASLHGPLPVQLIKDAEGEFHSKSYAELAGEVAALAAGFKAAGLTRGERVGLISDNRPEWLATDLALLGLGAADVPRGCDSTADEIGYILGFSECRWAVLENPKQLRKALASRERMPLLSEIVLIEGASADLAAEAANAGLNLRSLDELRLSAASPIGRGDAEGLSRARDDYAAEVSLGSPSDLATLIFTSGTTGEPKGVMLSHENFLYQTRNILDIVPIKEGQVFLSVLPIWHVFERIAQYIIITAGASVAYSKPVGSVMLADFKAVRPQWMASVPRIWESVQEGVYRQMRQQGGAIEAVFTFFVGVGKSYAYFRNHLLGRVPDYDHRSRLAEIASSILPFLLLAPIKGLGWLLVFRKIQDKLGGRFLAGISGGGALPPSVDRFFDAIGVRILEGYGLTETSPVVGVRAFGKPVQGTVGLPLAGTEVRIVDEAGKNLGLRKKGRILVRGPQVMLGYYKRPELTAAALHTDGYLDTGDLGVLTRHGELRIAGRVKDTIVLRGGENIEPLPIEQRLCESEYILQAVVLGQDQRFLASLIVPRQETVMAFARENNVPVVDYESLLKQPEILELLSDEIAERVSARAGFKSFERIFRFAILPRPFEVGRELSAKQETKRQAVNELYADEIAALFNDEGRA